MAYDPNDPGFNDNNSDPVDPYDVINRYKRAMQQANDPNNLASGTWSPAQPVNDPNGMVNVAAKSAQIVPPDSPATQTPYSPGSGNYPSNSIQTSQFGGALQQSLARIKNSMYLSQQQQPQSPQSFQMQGVTYPQFNQNSQSGQNGQGGAQPSTQSGQTGQQSFQTPGGQLDYNSLLKFYGINQPQIRQSPFMSNDFLQAHPTLGGALNNALFAAAGTQTAQGPSGAGTGISNVLRGVAGVPGAEREFQMNQQMAPFQMADAMAKLYGTTASAQEQLGRANYYNSITPERLAAAQLRFQSSEDKRGQAIAAPDGSLGGFLGNDNKFHSIAEYGIPAGTPMPTSGKAGNAPRPDMTELYIAASQGDKGAQAALDTYTRTQAGIAGGRNAAPGGPDDRQLTGLQQGIYNRKDSDDRATNAKYDKIIANPIISYNPAELQKAEANRQRELQANSDFAQQQIGRLQQRQQPQRPASGQNANQTPTVQSPNVQKAVGAISHLPKDQQAAQIDASSSLTAAEKRAAKQALGLK